MLWNVNSVQEFCCYLWRILNIENKKCTWRELFIGLILDIERPWKVYVRKCRLKFGSQDKNDTLWQEYTSLKSFSELFIFNIQYLLIDNTIPKLRVFYNIIVNILTFYGVFVVCEVLFHFQLVDLSISLTFHTFHSVVINL